MERQGRVRSGKESVCACQSPPEPHRAGSGFSTDAFGRQGRDSQGTAQAGPCIPGSTPLTPGWAPGHWLGLSYVSVS